MIVYARKKVREYFRSNSWNIFEDSEEDVFYKHRNPNGIKNYEFLSYSRKKGLVSASDMVAELEDFFLKKGYQKRQSREIIRPNGSSTFFITSGIQSFEENLLKGSQLDEIDSLFVQPVIRTNYMGNVEAGSVSSFVNPSTIRFNCSSDQYVEDLDSWMTFLSKSGLYLGDFIFKLKNKKIANNSQNYWKKNEGFVVSFFYGGLSLGDAGYCLAPNKQKPFEDIGFGLERLLWARNKTFSFKEIVGVFPYSFYQDIKDIDTFRTLSLMAMFDIEKNKNAYNQFKKYLSRINFPCFDIEAHINAYYKFWNQFINPQKIKQDVIQYLTNEINEIRNISLLEELGIKNTPKKLRNATFQDQDSFFRELVRLYPETILSLRELYKK